MIRPLLITGGILALLYVTREESPAPVVTNAPPAPPSPTPPEPPIATPPAPSPEPAPGLPTAPITRVQQLYARAEALLAEGMNVEPFILDSVAGDIAAIVPEHPLVQQLLQRAQAIRILRAQAVA